MKLFHSQLHSRTHLHRVFGTLDKTFELVQFAQKMKEINKERIQIVVFSDNHATAHIIDRNCLRNDPHQLPEPAKHCVKTDLPTSPLYSKHTKDPGFRTFESENEVESENQAKSFILVSQTFFFARFTKIKISQPLLGVGSSALDVFQMMFQFVQIRGVFII